MGKICTSADELIGKTPLLELTHLESSEQLHARVLAKKEEHAGKTIVVLLPDTGDRYLSSDMFE